MQVKEITINPYTLRDLIHQRDLSERKRKLYNDIIRCIEPLESINVEDIYHWYKVAFDENLRVETTFAMLPTIEGRRGHVQKLDKINVEWVRDHQLFSAIVQYLFCAASHLNSVKLYNILYVIIILNCSLNLHEVSEAQNKADQIYEAQIGKLLKDKIMKFKAPAELNNIEHKLQDELRDALEVACKRDPGYAEFLLRKICPQMVELKLHWIYSGYLSGIFTWFYTIFSSAGGEARDLYNPEMTYALKACSNLKKKNNLGEIMAYSPRKDLSVVVWHFQGTVHGVWPNLEHPPPLLKDRTLEYLVAHNAMRTEDNQKALRLFEERKF